MLFIEVEPEDSAEEESKETDDDGCDNWKTVQEKQKSKRFHKKKKSSETEISCSICGQYVITECELRAHMNTCHVKQNNFQECDFQASSKSILEKH